ncbi:MAG: hypothetical protein GY803_12535, partial [Chloroflexi bacterium]|nr:hypothetical protein [Chloroflexota bacterium]
ADALSQIEEAQRQAAATTEPTDTFVLEWNDALIRLYRDAWVAELSYSPYPLLTHIFFGDYTGASDIMRGYTHDQIFSADTPLIKGTMAEGSESWIPDYIFGQVNPAIAAQPDLAAAYYLRAWATFLQNPANPQIQADLDQAAALDPGEPLFTGTAPAANRIQFAPGATSAEISSQIADSGKEVYVLGAAAGQIMSVDLFSTDEFVRLEVSDSGGNWLDGQITPTFWQAELPQTADYVIRVVGGDAAADYTLIVAIPIRIQFEPGAISAQVQGDLNVYERDDYILRALAGQTMTVVINSPDNNVLLAIVGADGIPLVNGLMSSASKWSGQLPVTQDYNIRVLGMDQPATYTLDVTIE